MHGLPMTTVVSEDCSLMVHSQSWLVKGTCIRGGGAGASVQVLVLFHGQAPFFDELCS